MAIVPATALACPIDRLALGWRDGQLVCPRKHSFDPARQGYFNLLPVQFKRSCQPGDSTEMVSARRSFLETGAYLPIAQKLTETILTLDSPLKKCAILDAGCGEGYYLQNVAFDPRIAAHDRNYSFVGLDISKPAIVAATKRTDKVSWVVGAIRRPPILPASLDLILCIFCPHKLSDFSTLLAPGGRLLIVEAGERHLIEMREALYPRIQLSAPAAYDRDALRAAGVVQQGQNQLEFRLNKLFGQNLRNLLQMTPHYFRASPEAKEAFLGLPQVDLTVQVVFTILRAESTPATLSHAESRGG